MGPDKELLSQEIRELAEPELDGPFKFVWDQQLTLPARFRNQLPNSLEEKCEDVQGNKKK